MKLVIVTHYRCNEPEPMPTLLWAPDEVTEDQLQEDVDSAVRAYWELDAKLSENPPNKFATPYPNYQRFPDLTVEQVNSLWKVKHAEYADSGYVCGVLRDIERNPNMRLRP